MCGTCLAVEEGYHRSGRRGKTNAGLQFLLSLAFLPKD
jgi:hypothetical protein